MAKERNGKNVGELRDLRARLKKYMGGFPYPPDQIEVAGNIGISQGLLSLFLGRPKYRISSRSFGKILSFLEAKENAQKQIV